MSLNAKQKRFAEEYSVDHNGAQAAIRAGYSEKTAKQTASRKMANVAVKQLVAKLDAKKGGRARHRGKGGPRTAQGVVR